LRDVLNHVPPPKKAGDDAEDSRAEPPDQHLECVVIPFEAPIDQLIIRSILQRPGRRLCFQTAAPRIDPTVFQRFPIRADRRFRVSPTMRVLNLGLDLAFRLPSQLILPSLSFAPVKPARTGGPALVSIPTNASTLTLFWFFLNHEHRCEQPGLSLLLTKNGSIADRARFDAASQRRKSQWIFNRRPCFRGLPHGQHPYRRTLNPHGYGKYRYRG